MGNRAICQDEELKELMEEFDFAEEEAERLKELMDDLGLDVDEEMEVLEG